jgi:iron complex transport system substrate-binding protein
MNLKKISVLVIIAVIIVAAFVYVYYSTNTSASQTQGGITLTDDEGYQTTLTAVPQRIISLAPSVTPILYQIGVGDKIVGLTEYDDYPYNFSAWYEAGNMTCVGGFSTPNMEAIASVHPDVIFTTNINDQYLPNMRDLGYKVIVVGPKSIEGIYSTITLIGKATGAEANAATLVGSLRSQISDITATIAAANIAEKPKVYYEVWYDSSGVMAAGGGSWINDVITTAGGINVFANETAEFPSSSSEVVVTENPTVILLPTNMGMGTPSYGSIADVKGRPGWSAIDAVKNNRIYIIDETIFNQPGSRVADQVKAVAESLYPNLFPSTS